MSKERLQRQRKKSMTTQLYITQGASPIPYPQKFNSSLLNNGWLEDDFPFWDPAYPSFSRKSKPPPLFSQAAEEAERARLAEQEAAARVW